MLKTSQTITVKRKSPSYNVFKEVVTCRKLNPITRWSKKSTKAEANDSWKMTIPSLNKVAEQPISDLAEKTLDLLLPENNTWGTIVFDLYYTPYDSNLGADVDAKIKKFAYKQKGYELETTANTIPQVPNLVGADGGNYTITLKGGYPLSTEIRVIDKNNNDAEQSNSTRTIYKCRESSHFQHTYKSKMVCR